MSQRERGFTVLELIVVLIISLILLAVAVPNLSRMKMAANETSTIGSMRSVYNANISYAEACTAVGFSGSLPELNSGANCLAGAGLLDAVIASGNKSGYTFTYKPVLGTGGLNTAFNMTAQPVTANSTGVRGFYIDQTGVLRVSQTGAAGVASPPLQ